MELYDLGCIFMMSCFSDIAIFPAFCILACDFRIPSSKCFQEFRQADRLFFRVG